MQAEDAVIHFGGLEHDWSGMATRCLSSMLHIYIILYRSAVRKTKHTSPTYWSGMFRSHIKRELSCGYPSGVSLSLSLVCSLSLSLSPCMYIYGTPCWSQKTPVFEGPEASSQIQALKGQCARKMLHMMWRAWKQSYWTRVSSSGTVCVHVFWASFSIAMP